MSSLNLPENNIGEITLIGTGGGYGESAVIHIGNQNWIVVDSCINPDSKKSLPLEYLERIGVNISIDVKLIICSHWHDDHLLGISQLLENAKSAAFCMARASDRKKFLQLVALDYQKITKEVSNSSTIEFNNCLEILKTRKTNIKFAQENTYLYSHKVSEFIESNVISLSPSDYTILEFEKEISSLITSFGPINKKIIFNSPNSKSIVIFLRLGYHRAILGSDLEVSINEKEGWLNILDNNNVVDKKSTFFKIPHHGSKNGYHERIWSELLIENPISTLTPWNKKNKLPEAEMLVKYCEHSERVYMTSAQINEKPKKRNRSIEKMIEKMNYKIYEVQYKEGIIRSRIDIENNSALWEIALFKNAFHVNKILI
jgi:beta-lactamase superfamily II metal-dependent hydrolase